MSTAAFPHTPDLLRSSRIRVSRSGVRSSRPLIQRCTAVSADVAPSQSSAATYEDQRTEDILLSCTTFNVLAPIYKRLGGREDVRESQYPDQWRPRNQRIVQELLAKKSSIICLQELWLSNPELVSLYDNALGAHGYTTFKLPRPNNRGDGLMVAVRTGRLQVVEQEDLHFHDGGDRVAQFLWVRSREGSCEAKDNSPCHVIGGRNVASSMDPCTEVIVINTHLLFPHDSTSSIIRLRQVYKVLEHLEAFKTRHGLGQVPVVICGDLNGTKRGQVYSFLRSQGFVSSYDIANNHPDTDQRWVSHRNHHGKVCGVDYIWLLNPNETASQLALDWKAAVFKHLRRKLEEDGYGSDLEAFSFFCNPSQEGDDSCPSASNVITMRSMESAVEKIASELALTRRELAEIMAFADLDGGGMVCYDKFKEVLERCASAAELSNQNENQTVEALSLTDPQGSVPQGFTITDAKLFPPEMEQGEWPSHYTLSDHAVLTAVFSPLDKQN